MSSKRSPFFADTPAEQRGLARWWLAAALAVLLAVIGYILPWPSSSETGGGASAGAEEQLEPDSEEEDSAPPTTAGTTSTDPQRDTTTTESTTTTTVLEQPAKPSSTETVEPRPPAPDASFSVTSTAIFVGQSVTFTDLSVGDISARSWSFGDGTTVASASPTHRYNTAGTFTAELEVSGAGGSDVASTIIRVTHEPPTAVFDLSASEVPIGTTVAFHDQSTGQINSATWNYGDNTSGTTNSRRYDDPGEFTISLTVVGPGGSDTYERDLTVYVPPPSALIGVRPPNDTMGKALTLGQWEMVEFENLSSGEITSSFWIWEDKTYDTPNFGIQFSIPGDYVLSLTVIGPGGTSTDEVTMTVIGLE